MFVLDIGLPLGNLERRADMDGKKFTVQRVFRLKYDYIF